MSILHLLTYITIACTFISKSFADTQEDPVSTTFEGGRGLQNMQSARTYGKGAVIWGIRSITMNKESWIYTAPGVYIKRIDHPTISAIPLSFGLTDEIDINSALFLFRDARSLIDIRDVSAGYGPPKKGVGATYFGVKIRLPFSKDYPVQVAGKFGAFLDTSREELDGMNFRWTRKGTTIESSIYETFDIFHFMDLNFEQGYVKSASKMYNDQVVTGAGIQVTLKKILEMNLEMNNRTFLGAGPQTAINKAGFFAGASASLPAYQNDRSADFFKDYFVVSPSIALRFYRSLTLNLGANFNIADQAKPREKYQISAGITFNSNIKAMIDSDGDGVFNYVDAEPRTPKGFKVDKRGVALDSDGDGVPDGRDIQPDTPRGALVDGDGVGIDSDDDGVYDGLDREYQTPHGSMVDKFGVALDDDHDGISNESDKELKTPYGAVVNKDGIALDDDGDGVPNGIDREPETPRGAKVNAVGASIDSDGDHVPDGIDEEPNTPKGVLVDKRGRGLIKQEISAVSDAYLRLNMIHFGQSSKGLPPESLATLDEIGELLLKYPAVQIQIEGHTDNSGNVEKNLRLSRDRARDALEYLLKKYTSLKRDRFRVVGFGSDKPIASNATPEGRKMNMRVEFHIINRFELQKIQSGR
jgi:outer membrane protein OmpA-like peptidoglycan-associated protein